MPKVSEAHFETRRQQILTAAKRVCTSKPIYNVAMRDIVVESGMSQGGVYKYFSSIDEVFVALLNESALTDAVQLEIDDLFNADKAPGDLLDDFFNYIGSYLEQTMAGSGKVYFELTTLYASEPERFMRIREQIVQISVLEYVQSKFSTFIASQVETGYFRTVLSAEDISAFARVAIHGIAQDSLLAQYSPHIQGQLPSSGTGSLIKTLSLALRKLQET